MMFRPFRRTCSSRPPRSARWLAVALLAGLLSAPSAWADVPIPRERPDPFAEQAAVTAEDAIDAMIDPGGEDASFEKGKKLLTDRLTSSLAPYAAAADAATGTPADRESRLTLEARLAEGAPPLGSGVVWRVFAEIPDANGRLPLIRTTEGGTARISLRPGRYLVHAAFGRAGKSRLLEVDRPMQGESFVLDAGGLLLDARIGEGEARGDDLAFEIYAPSEIEAEERQLVAEARPGHVVPLPAGPYHIVSRYGDTNAVRRADLIVTPGKLTSVVMQHAASDVALKLVAEAGGEALADTVWTIETDAGRTLFDYVGAFPSLILAEGRYVARVRHGEREFVHSFEVAPDGQTEVEVLARSAPPGVQ